MFAVPKLVWIRTWVPLSEMILPSRVLPSLKWITSAKAAGASPRSRKPAMTIHRDVLGELAVSHDFMG